MASRALFFSFFFLLIAGFQHRPDWLRLSVRERSAPVRYRRVVDSFVEIGGGWKFWENQGRREFIKSEFNAKRCAVAKRHFLLLFEIYCFRIPWISLHKFLIFFFFCYYIRVKWFCFLFCLRFDFAKERLQVEEE